MHWLPGIKDHEELAAGEEAVHIEMIRGVPIFSASTM
jgi:hypothetical protein